MSTEKSTFSDEIQIVRDRAEAAKAEHAAARAELDAALAERAVAQMEEEIAAARSRCAENREGVACAALEFDLLVSSGSTGSGMDIDLHTTVALAQRNTALADAFLKQASHETTRAKQELKRARGEVKRASVERNKALIAQKRKQRDIATFDNERKIALEARARAESYRKKAVLARANAERAFLLLDPMDNNNESPQQESSPTSRKGGDDALQGGSMLKNRKQ